MAFTYTRNPRKKIDIWGATWVTYGTWATSAADSGGDIDTGLGYLYGIQLTPVATTANAAAPTVNETIPGHVGSAVSILFTAGAEGMWLAYGEQ